MVARFSYSFAKIAIGDPDVQRRHALKKALQENGYSDIFDSGDFALIHKSVALGGVDLLICNNCIGDDDDGKGDMCDLVHKMRHKEIGRNPFVVVIALIDAPTQSMVKRVIDAGVDDLVVRPFTTAQLLDRIAILARGRKPFVVTHNYIGPDRRTQRRAPDPNDPIPLDVPNPLRLKAANRMDPAQMQGIIDAAAAQVNEHKMERHSLQIRYLIDRIATAHGADGNKDTLATAQAQLLYAAEDLSRRLRGTRFAHVAELAMSLVGLVLRIQGAGEIPNQRDLDLLPKLGQAIERAFRPTGSVATTALEISSSLEHLTKQS
ncbi:MAG: response regulator transcription factor [Alphaproteobacteria bacterium]|nr:response regulator transcription factor [Alphaproteobacteria bacterium]